MNQARRSKLEKLNAKLLELVNELEGIKDAESEDDPDSDTVETLQGAWDSLDSCMSSIDDAITDS